MAIGSGLFDKQRSQKAHLVRGSGGLSAEIADLRKDIADELEAVAALAIEVFNAPAAADVDGIKQSIATATTAQTYSGAALDGVVGVGTMNPPRNVTVTASNSAPSYTGSVTFEGKDVNGNDIEVDVAITNNATTASTLCFASVSRIVVPAQNDVSGALEFGFGALLGLSQQIRTRNGRPVVISEVVGGRPVSDGVLVHENIANAPTADPNGFKLSIATSTSAQVYSGAALDGVVGTDELDQPRNVTVTASNSAPSYAGSVTFLGKDVYGNDISEAVAITNNATTAGTKCLKSVTSISVPAQNDTSGALEFGFGVVVGLSDRAVALGGASVPLLLQEVVNGSVVTTGALTLPATNEPNGAYTPASAPNGTNDYGIVYPVVMGSNVYSALEAQPNGAYEPTLAADGLRDYALYYEFDPTVIP